MGVVVGHTHTCMGTDAHSPNPHSPHPTRPILPTHPLTHPHSSHTSHPPTHSHTPHPLPHPLTPTLSLPPSVVLFAFVIPASLLLDTLGRRTLMMLSHAGMAVCLSGVAASAWAGQGNRTASAASLALIFLYCAFFALGAGPVPFTYASEIMPDHVRGKGMAFATGAHWVANIAGEGGLGVCVCLGVGGCVGGCGWPTSPVRDKGEILGVCVCVCLGVSVGG